MEFINPNVAKAKSANKLRISLKERCDVDIDLAKNIIKFNNESLSQEKLLIATLIEKDIIHLQGKRFIWADSEELIFVAPQASNATNDFALWLKNDSEGREIQSIFTDKVEKLVEEMEKKG